MSDVITRPEKKGKGNSMNGICLIPGIVLLFLSVAACGQPRWSSGHIYYGRDGRLCYVPDERGNTIPDFSHVGYEYGDVPLPDVPVMIDISPVNGNARALIQSAIDSLACLPLRSDGYRGAVLLKKGKYYVEGPVCISTGGIVLKGEGTEEGGTELIATAPERHSFLSIEGSGSYVEIPGSRRIITEGYVPVGRKFVVVNSTEGYRPGEDIILLRPGTKEWIRDLRMDQLPPKTNGGRVYQWKPEDYDLGYERKITRISGDTLFFRNPVVMAMEDIYGGGEVYRYVFEGRISRVGVEDIMFRSEYEGDEDENHAWIAIEFNNCSHSWVRNVSAVHFGYSCVSIGKTARNITVTDCSFLSPKSRPMGGRRYSFNCEGQLNLFRACYANGGRHDFVNGSRTCGPNVFTGCRSENSLSDAGPHHRWSTGTLFDMIVTDGEINVQDRGNSGTGHGWSGANMVFWNCRAKSSVCQSPWVSAVNYCIGFMGAKDAGSYYTDRKDGIWEGHNREGLIPLSLYEAQLRDRMMQPLKRNRINVKRNR